MKKFARGIVKARVPILIIAIVLLFPAMVGYMNMRINYDILTYLPENIDTMKVELFSIESPDLRY